MKKRTLLSAILICLSFCACARVEVRDCNSVCLRADECADGALTVMLPYLTMSYREDMIYSSRVNQRMMVFTDADRFTSFRQEMAAYFQFDVSYDGEASFNAQTAAYDADYFAENALILVHLNSTSGSSRYELDYLDNKGENCIVHIRENAPETGTDDEADHFLLLEIPQSELVEVTYYAAYISEKGTVS